MSSYIITTEAARFNTISAKSSLISNLLFTTKTDHSFTRLNLPSSIKTVLVRKVACDQDQDADSDRQVT